MSDTYTSISQPGNCVPSRQQRDITVPSLGSNTANQAEVSGDGSKTLLSLQQKKTRLIHLIGLSLPMTQSK